MKNPAKTLALFIAQIDVRDVETVEAVLTLTEKILGSRLEHAESEAVYDDPHKMGHSVEIPAEWFGYDAGFSTIVATADQFARSCAVFGAWANNPNSNRAALAGRVRSLFGE